MASSSSAKKVARVAARSGSAGGSSAGKAAKQRNWLFGVGIVAIVALGVGAVWFARDRNIGLGDNTDKPRARVVEGEPFDHWHAAFSLEACGKELAAVQDGATDVQGIHTHGDGLIHIHPFTVRAAGKLATMGRFFKQVGITVADDGFTTQDGKVYKAGETTCGGKETELVMAHWKDASTAASTPPDNVIRGDFGDVRFTEDLGAYTLALIAKGDDSEIKAPSAAAQIAELGAADGGAQPTEDPETTEVTVPEGDATDTTVPAEDAATTTVPADDTATTTAPADDASSTTAAGG